MFEQFGNFAIDLTIIQDILRNLELFDRVDYRDEWKYEIKFSLSDEDN